MLGDAGVGKSTLSISFKSGKSTPEKLQATIGFDLWTKIIKVDDKAIKALVYDTSGQEVFNSISKNYMRQGEGIIIVYDITDTNSFESVKFWVEEVHQLRSDSPPIFIIGNKADLEELRAIPRETGRAYASGIGATFIETSIKDFMTIEQAFNIAVKQVYCTKVEKEVVANIKSNLKLSKRTKPTQKGRQSTNVGC